MGYTRSILTKVSLRDVDAGLEVELKSTGSRRLIETVVITDKETAELFKRAMRRLIP